MRDPNRLYGFYTELMSLHMNNAPDIRVGQLFYNFSHWLMYEKLVDIFYVEEDKFMQYMKEYLHIKE